MTSDELQTIKEMGLADLYFFAKFILNYDWLDEKIHLPLCRILQDYETNKRVRVLLPRSWLKSTVCSIAYPIWRACRDCNVRILLVQNSATNAEAKLKSIRQQWEGNELLRALFPELLPQTSETWTSKSLCLRRTRPNNENTFEAAGRGTQLTGRHYNLIVEDDTVAPDKDEWTEDNVLPVKEDIGQAIGFHHSCIPMLVEAKNDQILVVGTRWFQVDLLSWVGEKEPWYVTYERAVREKDGKPSADGVVTWPEKFDEETLEGIEQSMGPYLFACLYLNNPLRAEDMIFQPGWFDYYEHVDPRYLEIYITIDPAGNPKNSVAKKKKNDYNVIMVAGRHMYSGLIYVMEYVEFKGGPGELVQKLFAYVARFGDRLVKVGVEAVAYQESLEYIFSLEMAQRKVWFELVLIKHSGARGSMKKEYRIRSLQPLVRAGTIKFKATHGRLIGQLATFPLGANDDLADALSMFLQLWSIEVIVDREAPGVASQTTELEEAVRSIAAKLRPPSGSVFDVMTDMSDGRTSRDPYAHLWHEDLDSKPSVN